jgi:four helix bundle protein
MKPRCFTDLIAWQKAMDLVEAVYRATRGFPSDERFGLTSQVRRAVVSVPSNIAEGQGRASTREFLHFLSIAYGSLLEVETQIHIAHRLGYMEAQQKAVIMAATNEIGRVLNGPSASLKAKQPPTQTGGH